MITVRSRSSLKVRRNAENRHAPTISAYLQGEAWRKDYGNCPQTLGRRDGQEGMGRGKTKRGVEYPHHGGSTPRVVWLREQDSRPSTERGGTRLVPILRIGAAKRSVNPYLAFFKWI